MDYVTIYPAGLYASGTGGGGDNPDGHAPCGCGYGSGTNAAWCCDCPAHNPKPPDGGPAVTNHLRLVSADYGLTVCTGERPNLVPLKAGDTVHPGERVYVTGNTPSGLPRDRTVTFRYDKDGEPVIHSFTVLDAYVFGSFSGSMGNGDIALSLDPPPGGLPLFVGGPQRQVNTQSYVLLPGQTVVTLGGTPGAIRLNIPYNNTKLEYGQSPNLHPC
jgi:hypothetical protein